MKYDPTYSIRHDSRNRKRVNLIVKNMSACNKLLDIGCNKGYFSQSILENNLALHVDAVELNRGVVDDVLQSNDRFTLYEKDIVDFYFEKKYSIIIYGAVHHHVLGNHGYLESMHLWNRIVNHCETSIFFETGMLNEGSRWYWQRRIRRYYSGDEEYIGALLQAIGPRLKRVTIIGKYWIHQIRRWLLRIDLWPYDNVNESFYRYDFSNTSLNKLKSYYRTIGSKKQKLLALDENNDRSLTKTSINNIVYEGTIFSIYKNSEKNILFWNKKILDDNFKEAREYCIGQQIDNNLFIKPITIKSDIGLIYPYIKLKKISEIDIRVNKNKINLINQLLDLFEYAYNVRINMGNLDLNPHSHKKLRRLIDIIDINQSNILIKEIDNNMCEIGAIVDLEYFCNHNKARNSLNFSKIILKSNIFTGRNIKFLIKALYWNFCHYIKWTFAPVEQRLYEKNKSIFRYLIMRSREVVDRLLRSIPGYWQ